MVITSSVCLNALSKSWRKTAKSYQKFDPNNLQGVWLDK